MSKWLLTADWQTDYKNLDVCRQAHEDEVRIGREYDVKGIIDLGDLKDDYNPVDWKVADFQKKRWSRLDRIFEHNILLMGNHDRLGQYTSERNWFSLFKGMKLEAVDTPRVIGIGNIVFACLPYIRDEEELKKAAKWLWKRVTAHHRKILLFHCDVQGADYGLGLKSTTGIRQRDLLFDRYDMCFGGHVHKGQWLSEKALYVANPFCFSWGERNQEKGFVIYDSDSQNVKRIPSSIPNWYDYSYAKKHSIGKGSHVQVTVDCSLDSDYFIFIEKARVRAQKRFLDCHIYTKPNFIQAEQTKAVVVATDSDEAKIKSYIASSVAEDMNKRQILKYLLSKLSATNVRSVEELRFISVEAKNVLSFKELEFSYENRGVCLVQGINKDWPNHSNGAGKTNFLSLLPIALSGQTFKEQKNDGWINEHTNKRASVHLRCKIKKARFRIERERKPVKLKFISGNTDESTGLRHRGSKETQGVIERTLGFTLSILKSSVYIDSSLPKAFLEGTQKDRTELISKFQNLERFKIAHDLVSKDLGKAQFHVREIQDVIEAEEFTRKECKAEWAELQKQAVKSLREYAEAVLIESNRYNRAKETVRMYGNQHSYRLLKLEKRYNDLFKKHTETDKEIYSVTNEMNKQKRELEKASITLKKICPVCKQRVPASLRDNMREHLEADLKVLRTKFDALYVEGQQYKRSYEIIFAKIQKIKDHTLLLETAKTERAKALDAAKIAMKTHKDSLKIHAQRMIKLKVKIFAAKRNIARSYQLIEEERKDVAMLSYCQKAFSRDGLPLYLNNLVCPLLNTVAQDYSQLFTDGEIQVVFRLNDGEFEPTILNAHGSKEISGQSGGEKAWAGIITSLALRELAPKTNLLILDEPGYGLDNESALVLGKKLLLLKDRFETVLVTTHNQAIASILDGDKTITIVKRNKCSKLA